MTCSLNKLALIERHPKRLSASETRMYFWISRKFVWIPQWLIRWKLVGGASAKLLPAVLTQCIYIQLRESRWCYCYDWVCSWIMWQVTESCYLCCLTLIVADIWKRCLCCQRNRGPTLTSWSWSWPRSSSPSSSSISSDVWTPTRRAAGEMKNETGTDLSWLVNAEQMCGGR